MDKYNNVVESISLVIVFGGDIEFAHNSPIYIFDKSLKVASKLVVI